MGNGGQPGRSQAQAGRRHDVFASTPLIDINDVQRKSGAFIGSLLLLMILLSILGIVAQAAFA